MLKAGYKANVIPQKAEAVVDCRVLPGRQAAFEAEIDELIGPNVTREWITHLDSYETTFDGHLVDAMNEAILAHDPDGKTVRTCCPGHGRESVRQAGHPVFRIRTAATAARPRLRGAVPRRR